jgi:hypothetical protein
MAISTVSKPQFLNLGNSFVLCVVIYAESHSGAQATRERGQRQTYFHGDFCPDALFPPKPVFLKGLPKNSYLDLMNMFIMGIFPYDDGSQSGQKPVDHSRIG